ncbi:hypothetical protein [Streptomyces sp. MST-110588]|uniref:hypothetical protein n=1 Tax=Streptomyces sp. MST-110588 TaxID=2833628 RepID=UPI001F5E1E96|nr:hypothetical protein [Streptomyces sp. MST-110588]UNO41665.1 hypothetical protein KGS77_21595 [Streptomyces sp. MST-110588]
MCAASALLALPATSTTAAAEDRPAAPRTSVADDHPSVGLSGKEAAKGGTVTVTGRGWRPRALLTVLICGQNMAGGTDTCANGAGRAVTTGGDGSFRRSLPVAEPPRPCPCVVHVATVTGPAASAATALRITGHPVAPVPREPDGAPLTALAPPRLEGSSGLLTWFGAPPRRRLVVTVGNRTPDPVRNPVFEVGVAHGVYAPAWEEQQWRGTVPAGGRARISLPVELAAGAHGDYYVSLKHAGKILAEQPWGVGRPWGVTLFRLLLCLVVPAAVFRIGMAAVDRLRPRDAAPPARTRGGRSRTPQPDRTPRRPRTRPSGRHRSPRT